MRPFIFYALLITSFLACSKDSFIESGDATLSVSADEINFDTIFTTTGSVTRQVKIFNDNSKKLRLSKIMLRRGEASYFSFNADGKAGPDVQDVEINANDSIYVYVSVSIDPNEDTLPFIINDTIDIIYNGNTRSIALTSWGQNAFFIDSKIITKDTTWTNTRPIVIRGGVLVGEGIQLKIEEGTRVYLHADAPLIVEGSLIAEGQHYDSTKIIFQGDRLDRYYRDLPGSWPGIYFTAKSEANSLQHVIVRNAYQGIVSESPATSGEYKVHLKQCIIENCYDAGIIGVNTGIHAVNTLISNSGKNIILVKGGRYLFEHCTNAALGNAYVQHKQPALTVTDYLKEGDDIKVSPLKAEFVNTIIWGNNGTVEDEIVTLREGAEPFDVHFLHCIVKFEERPAHATLTNVIENEEPLFREAITNELRYNFRLQEGSAGIDDGIPTGVNFDLDERPRTGVPDIGAYETTF